MDDVKKLIMKSPTKSCSLDPIPTDLLKQCLDVLLPIIVDIINLSLSSGGFPAIFKLALVIPLLKKIGLQLIFPSFRPVPNLQFLSKVTERAVAAQFIDYCEINHGQPKGSFTIIAQLVGRIRHGRSRYSTVAASLKIWC